MAPHAHYWATRRSHQRRQHRLASGTPTGRCRNLDARSSGKRRDQRRGEHQLRSLGAAGGYRAIRRSFAERPLGGVLAILQKTRWRNQAAARDHASRRTQRRLSMPTQFPAFSRLLHWTMAAMVLTMLFIG